jgi:hypothetical protein
MIIFTRLGFLVPILVLAALVGTELVFELLYADDRYYQEHDWAIITASIIGGALIWRLGRHLNRDVAKKLVDPDTGDVVLLAHKHSFFFLPMEHWGLIIPAFAVLLLSLEQYYPEPTCAAPTINAGIPVDFAYEEVEDGQVSVTVQRPESFEGVALSSTHLAVYDGDKLVLSAAIAPFLEDPTQARFRLARGLVDQAQISIAYGAIAPGSCAEFRVVPLSLPQRLRVGR